MPWLVAFEYGGIGPNFEWRSESAVIAEQVPRMAALVHTVNPSVVNLSAAPHGHA